MAQKQQQYESAADSVFNFIFAGARRNMRAAPPKDLKGLSGDEMAYALGEVALSPAVYANEEFLGVLGEPLDSIEILEVKTGLDKRAVPAKVGVSAKGLSEFIFDPESAIEKAFGTSYALRQKANKLNRARGFGGVIDLGIGAVAARAAGYSTSEAIKRGWGLANERMDQEKRNNWALGLAASASAFEAGAARGWDYDTTEKVSRSFSAMLDASYNKVDFTSKAKIPFTTEQDDQVKNVVKKNYNSKVLILTKKTLKSSSKNIRIEERNMLPRRLVLKLTMES